MVKSRVFLFFFLLAGMCLFAQTAINDYKPEVLRKVNAGAGPNDLAVSRVRSLSGPTTFLATRDNTFIVLDSYNSRINEYDGNMNVVRTVYDNTQANKDLYTSEFVKKDYSDGALVLVGPKGLFRLKDNAIVFSLKASDLPFTINNGNYYPFDGYVFFYDTSKNLKAYDTRGWVIEHGDTMKILQKNEGWLKGFITKEEALFIAVRDVANGSGLLHMDGLVQSTDFKAQQLYWGILRSNMKSRVLKDKISFNADNFGFFSLVGFDSDDNSYWSTISKLPGSLNKKVVVVFSKYGEAVDAFFSLEGVTQATFDGDVIIQTFDNSSVTYFKIKRRWGTDQTVTNVVESSTLKPTSITASSVYIEKYDINAYRPAKAFDGKPNTGWTEAVQGPGIGEWVAISFDKPVTIDRLSVSPGWFDKDYWIQNNRIKLMRIELDDYYVDVKFDDTMVAQKVNLPEKRTFTRARFTVKDVYKTTNFDDTCITEIEFWYQDRKLDIDLNGFSDQFKVIPE